MPDESNNHTNNPAAAATVVGVSVTPKIDEKQAEDISRRFSREDGASAINVISASREEALEQFIDDRTKVANGLRDEYAELADRYDALCEGHILNLNYEALDNAANALEAAELGTYVAICEDMRGDDKERILSFSTCLVRLSKDKINKTREIERSRQLDEASMPGGYGFSYEKSDTVIGNRIKIDVPYSDISGLVEVVEEQATLAKKIEEVESKIKFARESKAGINKHRKKLQLQLDRYNLSHSENGRKILSGLNAKAFEGLEDLLPNNLMQIEELSIDETK